MMGVSESPFASVRNNEMSDFSIVNQSCIVWKVASLVVSP